MKIRLMLSSIWSLMIILAPCVFADDWIQTIERFANGHINWTRGILSTVGVVYLAGHDCNDAIVRAIARESAHQNMLTLVEQLRIDDTTKISSFVRKSPFNRSKIEEMVENARLVGWECIAHDMLTTTLELNLRGGFTQFVLPAEFRQVEGVKPVIAGMKGSPGAAETQDFGHSKEGGCYTGLIVDARGINSKTALAPRIFDEHDREIYGSAFVSREFAVQQGICGYVNDLHTAVNANRVAGNPMLVKALRSRNPGSTDIVISNTEAARIRRTSDHLSFLRQCRVIVVVNPFPSSGKRSEPLDETN
jgi:hypothetical protein